MTQLKDSTKKNVSAQPVTLSLSVQERIEFFANIIVDRIIDDQASGQKLLERIRSEHGTGTITTA